MAGSLYVEYDYVVSGYFTEAAGVSAETQRLDPSARVELFELDATSVGGTIYRFHAGKNGLIADVVWQGLTYSAYPIEASGFEMSGKGALPRPTIRVSNVLGTISALVLLYEDLAGCKVTRIRTMVKFLDGVNFAGGTNPTADDTAEYPRDVYVIDRRSGEDRDVVEFELASSLDMAGVMFPSRQVIQNYCPWVYRGSECGYAGTNYFDTNDLPAATIGLDVCGKRLSSCRKRFGQYGELPYGGFPAVGMTRF
jgi:lambda family phage minor tail protein L